MGIQYSDGTGTEARILSILKAADDLTSANSLDRGDAPWAVHYHLTSQRANLLRHLSFEGLRVLELGAGMGAISRYLAEESEYLKIIEGTEARFRAATERLRGLDNWEGEIANIQDVIPTELFDVVCAIGVMEYSELYLSPRADGTAFDRFLELAKSHLAPGGVIIVAIENQLGLKYWSGAAEDHTNSIADGISGYASRPTPRTLPRKSLLEVFHRNGFGAVEEYYPFPDYKIPSTVLSSALIDEHPTLASQLATVRQFESYGARRVRFFPDVLAIESVSEAGLLKDFSNSFLIVATSDTDNETFKAVNRAREENEVAWHYSAGRARPTATIFTEKSSGVWVTKRLAEPVKHQLSPSRSREGWNSISEPVVHGVSLRSDLIRTAYFDGTLEALKILQEFLSGALHAFQLPSGGLAPNALDVIYHNVLRVDSEYKWFDLEWTNGEPVSKSWFVCRNLLVLRGEQEFWVHDGAAYSLTKIYKNMCRKLGVEPDLSGDIRKEAKLRSEVLVDQDCRRQERALRSVFRQPFVGLTYPRRTGREFLLRHLYGMAKRPSLALLLRMPIVGWYAMRNKRDAPSS